MDILHILQEASIGSLKTVLTIAKFLIPLMFAIEILKALNILDRLSDFLQPVSKLLGLSKEASFPLLVGLILGLSYGAGVIIKSSKEGNLSKKDLYLLMIFLVTCHSVIEDTLLFVAIGASGWLLLGIRIPLAIILTALVAWRMNKKQEKLGGTL